MADSKAWFITGCSKGFGRIWATAALERGDKVAATARDASTLEALAEKYGDTVLTMALDVQNHDADFAAVERAHEAFGRLDVVVNNAGYGLFGAIEEVSQEEARDQLETNLFGIDVTLVEPQGFSTDWSGPSAVRARQMDVYGPMRERRKKQLGARKRGDPEASGAAILKLVDAERPPLRCFFGATAFDIVRPDYEGRLANWEEWDWLAKEAHGDE